MSTRSFSRPEARGQKNYNSAWELSSISQHEHLGSQFCRAEVGTGGLVSYCANIIAQTSLFKHRNLALVLGIAALSAGRADHSEHR